MTNGVLKLINEQGISPHSLSGVPYDTKLAERVVDTMMKLGVRKNADVIDYQSIRNFQKAGGRIKNPAFMDLSDDTVSKATASRTFKFAKANTSTHDFTTSGSAFLINDFTLMIAGVIQEVYDTSADTSLTEIFPAASVLARTLAVSIFAAPGGLSDAYNYGEPVKEIAKIGNRTQAYSGIPYRNFMTITEEEGTFWRDVGNPDLSARGLLQRLTMYALQAKVVMNNRINLIRASVFNNGISYYNDNDPMTTVSYQIPLWNFVTSVTDPVGKWGTVYLPSNVAVPNPNANPIIDLMYLLKQAPALISRFGRMRKARLIMSPITQVLFLENPNVQNKIVIIQAAPGSPVNPRGQYDVDFLIRTQIPGIDVDVEVDPSGYLTQNSDVTWLPDGSGFVQNYNNPYNYFIPPGAVLFAIDVEDKGGKLGEFVFTAGVQNGGFAQATAAPWFIVEDLSLPGTRGGPSNPSLQLNFGFAGNLAIYHPEAVIVGNFANVVQGPPPAESMFKSFVEPKDSKEFSTLNKTGDQYTEKSFAVEDNKAVLTDVKKVSKHDFNDKMKGEK